MKKWIIGLLVAVCAVCSALLVTACAYEELEHNWDTKWSNNDRNHWHECLDEDCSVRNGVAAHDWVLDELIADPTCDQPGSGVYSCSVCRRQKEDEVPATGEHIWRVEKSRDPSCWLDGYIIRQCALCLNFDQSILPATAEHDFDETAWVGSSLGHYHPCKRASAGCTAISNPEIHEKSESPTNIIPPGAYKDGKIIYGCTVCNYEVDFEILSATATPLSLEPHFFPNYEGSEGNEYGEGQEVWWEPNAPEAEVTYDERTGEYSAILYQDSGFGSPPTYPYELHFKGKNQAGQEVDVEIWGYGATHGINVYLYNTDYESKSPITWQGANLNYSYSMEGKGILRIRDVGTYKLIFVYEIGDADRDNVTEKCEVTVNVTVVPYPNTLSVESGFVLVLDTAPVVYFDGNIRRRMEF